MTASCISCSNNTCSAKQNSSLWCWTVSIAVLSFSLCLVLWVMFVQMDFIMDVVRANLRWWKTKTTVYVLLNILILTICLSSRPINLSQEMGFLPSSSSHDVSESYIFEKIKPYCNIFGEATAEVDGKKNTTTNSNSLMGRSATTMSNLCCSQASEKQSPTVRACSTKANSLVVFEIGEFADEEYHKSLEPRQKEEKAVVSHYREMEIGKEELYYRAESFIKNFRRQLRMQRDDSWNTLSAGP